MWQGGKDAKPGKVVGVTRNRRKTPRGKSFSMKRVGASLKEMLSETVIPVRVVLNDLNPRGLGLFSTQKMVAGHEIMVSMTEPRRIDLHGRITWCELFNLNSKVIDPSGEPFSYRVGVQFIFANTAEEKAMADFCRELVALYIAPQVAVQATPIQSQAAPTEATTATETSEVSEDDALKQAA